MNHEACQGAELLKLPSHDVNRSRPIALTHARVALRLIHRTCYGVPGTVYLIQWLLLAGLEYSHGWCNKRKNSEQFLAALQFFRLSGRLPSNIRIITFYLS